MKLTCYADIKAEAIRRGISLQYELPSKLGYKSRWGLVRALQKDNATKKQILFNAKLFFKNQDAKTH